MFCHYIDTALMITNALIVTQGFQTYQVFNAWDAFLYLTRNEEYSFPRVIGKKQQFDEHEALLATCLHYSVRIAKTRYGSDAIANFLHETDNAISSMLKPRQPSVSLIGEDSSDLVLCNLDKKFTGHTTLRSQHSMLVFGGTGENSQRGTALQVVTVSSESNENRVETKCVKDDWRLFERVYSSAVFHQRTNSFYIFGGRKSPQTLCDSDLVQISTKPPYVVKTLSFQDSECPGGRWRSSMIVVANDLLLFGGKTDKVNYMLEYKNTLQQWLNKFLNCVAGGVGRLLEVRVRSRALEANQEC